MELTLTSLAAELEFLRSTLSELGAGVCRLSSDGKVLWANPAYCDLLGYSLDEIIGLSIKETSLPEEMQLQSEAIKELIAGKRESFSMDKRYRRKDGTLIWAHLVTKLQRDKDGQPANFLTIVQDITELMESESSRKHTENLLNLVLDAMPGLVAYIDQDFRYRFCNQAYKKWFNMRPQTLIGKTVAEVLGLEAFELILPVYQRVLGGETVEWEGHVPYQAGGMRAVRSNYVPDWGPDGKIRGFIVLVLDVTSLKEGEKVIMQQRERLTQSARLAALGEMASGIAHEINNPLSIIFARTEILKDHAVKKTLDPEKVASWADKLSDTALKISKIVKSVRAISRNGDVDPFESICFNSMLDEIQEICAGRFKRDQIRLDVEIQNKDISLDCRRVQLEQVILNLLNNACDAALSSQERWIKLQVKEAGENVEISVTDSGPGISAELEQKIFLAFFTTKPVGQGTGLGLSLSQNIVRSHRGTLTLDRSFPHTRFVITLPKRQSTGTESVSSTA